MRVQNFGHEQSGYEGDGFVVAIDGDEARENGHPPCEILVGPGLSVREIFFSEMPPGEHHVPIAKYEAQLRKMVDDIRSAFPRWSRPVA